MTVLVTRLFPPYSFLMHSARLLWPECVHNLLAHHFTVNHIDGTFHVFHICEIRSDFHDFFSTKLVVFSSMCYIQTGNFLMYVFTCSRIFFSAIHQLQNAKNLIL